MDKELGTIKFSKTDSGIRIDLSGELANCCCCSQSADGKAEACCDDSKGKGDDCCKDNEK